MVWLIRDAVAPGGREDRAFHDSEHDRAFSTALKQGLKPDIVVVEIDAHINDAAFAEQSADLLYQVMSERN